MRVLCHQRHPRRGGLVGRGAVSSPPSTSAQTPTGLSATYEDGQVRVEWTDASLTADLFLVRWWEDGSLTTNLETAVASPFLHYPVTADTTYFYQVGASNTVNGSFSGFSGAVSETTPFAIEGRITPVAGKQSNSFSLQRTVDNLLNAIGMNNEETILYNLDGSQPNEPTSANGVAWVTTSQLDEATAAAEGRVWIIADLGALYDLTAIDIWNFQWNLSGGLQNRGVSQFDVYVRTTVADTDDGTVGGTEINLDNPNDALIDNDAVFNLGTARRWKLALETSPWTRHPTPTPTPARRFDLTGHRARFVALVVDSYHGGGGIGLGKVRFTGRCGAAHRPGPGLRRD